MFCNEVVQHPCVISPSRIAQFCDHRNLTHNQTNSVIFGGALHFKKLLQIKKKPQQNQEFLAAEKNKIK